MELDDGPTAPARVRRVGANMIELTIHEGRNRQVRRMCQAVGHPVLELVRTRFGPLALEAWRPAPIGASGRGGRAPARAHALTQSRAMRLFALRGATSVERNNAQDILDATSELMREIMQRNALEPAAVVSCIFTATRDLNAEFPAVAARALGFERVPLLCARRSPCRARCRA